MKPDLQAYLDGELSLEELSTESKAEAAAWDGLAEDMKRDGAAGAPGWLEGAVMTELALKPSPARRETVLQWLLRARTIQLSPLTGALAAAALAVVLFLPRSEQSVEPGGVSIPSPILVEFKLEAPGATTVGLAGDFNDWQAELVLEDRDGDGIWTGRLAVEPGVHKYMFVIDGTEWVTDPDAQRYSDDGFGNRNAVLAVTPIT